MPPTSHLLPVKKVYPPPGRVERSEGRAEAWPLYSQEISQQNERSEKTEEAIFSGPQPGERLPPLNVRIVLGDNAGEDVNILSDANGKPVFLIFMNRFNGEGINELVRIITAYVEQRNEPELVTAVVWVTSNPNDLETKIKRASERGGMPKNTPVAISLEGPEGPGAYGLNRHADMTVLIADDDVVSANFALVRPSINADSLAAVPKLVKANNQNQQFQLRILPHTNDTCEGIQQISVCPR